MDWLHDPDGEEGSEGMRKFGHAVIVKKVDEEESFPLSAEEFVEEYGDDPVRMDFETVVSVADVFEYVDAEEFEDIVDMHRAVGDALRASPYWQYNPQVGESRSA
ncbi:DUF5785 family protein [Halorarius halobius]|uniref:DUF5785 family protein n=1 Tax=Halorarius halobius TaxID=2962671 RepID=UPI0020CBD327|nr:DUF5785 family protein [Halorarius halobius]